MKGVLKNGTVQQDIYVDLFVKHFPDWLQRIINVVVYACVTAFLAVATYYQ